MPPAFLPSFPLSLSSAPSPSSSSVSPFLSPSILPTRCPLLIATCCLPPPSSSSSSPSSASPPPSPPPSPPAAASPPPAAPSSSSSPLSTMRQWWAQGSKNAAQLRYYGVAALISYGLFDFLTYAVSFLIALYAYLAAGKVLSWHTLPQVLAIMWGINNLSRPFRIAGALAIAPLVDRKVVKPVSAMFGKAKSENDQNPQ